MQNFLKLIIKFSPFAVIITCAFGLIALEVQQNYRQSANDPQIQMAEDVANAVNSGQNSADIVSSDQKINLSDSLAPFIIFYNSNQKPIEGSGYLDNVLPGPPSGTFNVAKNSTDNEDRFTWQPNNTVRIAAVLVSIDNGNKGYVLAGRSLKEVEIREDNLNETVLLAWFITMIATSAIIAVTPRLK
jgi:hypothetical protein